MAACSATSHVQATPLCGARCGGFRRSLASASQCPSMRLPSLPPKCQTARGEKRALVCVAMAGHGVAGVEPDLPEEVRASWLCAGEEMQEDGSFPYGKVDGAHTWYEGDDEPWWDQIQQSLERAGGPVGFQKILAWGFLPLLFSGLAFGVEPLFYIGLTVLFIFSYIGQEMAKPTKYTAYEPEKSRNSL